MSETYKEANCSAMVQIVARRLCQLHNSDPDKIMPSQGRSYEGVAGAVMAVKYATEPHPLWMHFVADARTAIEAMREPTQTMIDAYVYDMYEPDQRVQWQQMIDAALNQK